MPLQPVSFEMPLVRNISPKPMRRRAMPAVNIPSR
jgi:hypothetical protein